MGLLLVLRPPQPRPQSLRRATRAQRRERHRADAEVNRLETVAGNDVERGLVAALRALLARWRDEPGLSLHWHGD